jgi:hypothetical protein
MGIFDRIRKKGTLAENSGQKYAISLFSGRYEMRPPDINLWCIGSDCKPCVVVVPLSAWERMNSIITLTSSEQWDRLSSPNAKHSQEQKLTISITDIETGEELSHEATTMANCGFKDLYTDTPIFLPVLMSVATVNSFCVPLEHYIENHLTPPKSLAQGLLQNVEFIESDKTLLIPLYRRSKNPRRYDKFSMLPNGDKIEIFETYTVSS